MTAPVIAITNRKGGVGKSTMSTHLATGLATLGYRVGLIDTDSQGHAGLLLKMPAMDALYNILVERHALSDVVREVPSSHYATADLPAKGALYLLSSAERTMHIPHLLQETDTFLFVQLTEAFAADYALDVIILDTHPTLSKIDGMVWLSVDGFIYVTECSRLSFDGIAKAVDQLKSFGAMRKRYMQRETSIIGIIPNKLRSDTRLHRQNIAKLARKFGEERVWTPVRLRIAWEEAANELETIYTWSPSGEEAEDAWRIVRRTEEALKWLVASH